MAYLPCRTICHTQTYLPAGLNIPRLTLYNVSLQISELGLEYPLADGPSGAFSNVFL
jgi:hypothetical protein